MREKGVVSRKRIIERKKAVTDQEFFLSEPYRASLGRLARTLGKKASVAFHITYDESPESSAAFTDGEQISLNAGNHISMSFPSREEKALSHEGLTAHECGHIRCSDFDRRRIYVEGFGKGCCYPSAPKPEGKAEEKAWEEIKAYLKHKDSIAVFWIEKTAAYLNNILEDVYIEDFMCREYPGTVRSTIQKNAAAVVKGIPTMQERKKMGGSGLDIMMDLVFRYVRAGKTLQEKQYTKEYRDSLKRCKRWIDRSVADSSPDIRFHASNQLMLKIWKYLKKEIIEAKKQAEDKKLSAEQVKKMLQEQHKKVHWVCLSEGSTGGRPVPGYPKGWKGSLEEESCQTSSEKDSGPSQHSPSYGIRKFSEEAELKEDEKVQEEKEQWNILDELPMVLNQLASDAENREKERERKEKLQSEMGQMPRNAIHADCHYEFHRELIVSEESIRSYQEIEAEIKQLAKNLAERVEDILQKQEGGTLKGLYMGKRLSRSALYRRDGKVFEKKIQPDTENSIAFAILVDISGSMEGERIDCAKKAALLLYRFCSSLSIPILVYGHSTHTERKDNGYIENVDICSFAEFDSIDGKDAYRIAGMKTLERNRDGAALRYVGERLLKREEDTKVLVLLSDGLPNAVGYSGEPAKRDLQETKRNLEKRGIHLFAASIGEDREIIEDIYKEGFLNISDLRTMPQKLVKLLTAYIH